MFQGDGSSRIRISDIAHFTHAKNMDNMIDGKALTTIWLVVKTLYLHDHGNVQQPLNYRYLRYAT